jgi:Holliday junction resolvasome RuvABC DNA-binding subunit
MAEAVSAMVNLGYSASHALTAVSAAAGKLGGSVGLEELIRAALGELAPAIKDHG